MIARSQLAILYFNSGVGLSQAFSNNGKLRFKQQFSKVTQSWVIKKVMEPKQKLYIDHLLQELQNILEGQEKQKLPKLLNVPKNIAPTEKPDKEQAILNKRTRFST